jgi:hypothetical protein
MLASYCWPGLMYCMHDSNLQPAVKRLHAPDQQALLPRQSVRRLEVWLVACSQLSTVHALHHSSLLLTGHM